MNIEILRNVSIGSAIARGTPFTKRDDPDYVAPNREIQTSYEPGDVVAMHGKDAEKDAGLLIRLGKARETELKPWRRADGKPNPNTAKKASS